MIKVVSLLLFILLACACEPVGQAHTNKTSDETPRYSCLKSQSDCLVKVDFGDFMIEFSGQVEQGRIKTELPFMMKLTFTASEASYQLKQISSYLEGVDMFMGKIPVLFQPDKQADYAWVAQTLLASCSEEIMTWRLWLQVDIVVKGQVEQQQFFIDFASQRL